MNKYVVILFFFIGISCSAYSSASVSDVAKVKKEKVAGMSAKEFKEFQQKLHKEVVDEKPLPFASHVMCIFLDDSEVGFRTITQDLAKALEQKACPIVCSATLLKNFLTGEALFMKEFPHEAQRCLWVKDRLAEIPSGVKADVVAESSKLSSMLHEIIDNYATKIFTSVYNAQKEVLKGKSAVDSEKQATEKAADAMNRFNLCLYAASFNPAEWIIRKPNESLYVLIPKTYLPVGVKGYALSARPLPESAPITQAELLLGLKIDHMAVVTDDQMSAKFLLSESFPEPEFADYFIQAPGGAKGNPALWDDRAKNSALFVTNADYKKFNGKSSIVLFRWAIFLTGHGRLNYSIAHINIDVFKYMLQFLENKIVTKFFMYDSCYAAGFNAQRVYADLKRRLAGSAATWMAYPFVIVTSALTDAPTVSVGTNIEIDFERRIVKVPVKLDYKAFVEGITKDTVNFTDLVSYLVPKVEQVGGIATTPQIKLAGVPWFTPLGVNEHVVSIGYTLAKTREQPVDIQKYFRKKNPTAILLYAEAVPFELQINTPPDPLNSFSIVPMSAWASRYFLAKISSTTRTVQDIIYSFIRVKKRPSHAFFIGEIEGLSGAMACLGNKKGFSSIAKVIIHNVIDADKVNVYFRCQDKLYATTLTYFDVR